MRDVQPAIREGHYAAKQICSRAALIAWSHRRRFETALDLARSFRGKRLVDFGCGDGTFLGLLMATPFAPGEAIGIETSLPAVEDCRRRLGADPRLAFALPSDITSARYRERYDAVFCMEVFEHVVDLEPLLSAIAWLLKPDGRLIVSVPVETGLPLIAKQIVRRVAGWRGIGHYPGTAPYRFRELVASVLAGPGQHLVREPFDAGAGPSYDHKGFNWMALRDLLARRFEIERTVASPFGRLGPHLATQVWFVARPRLRP